MIHDDPSPLAGQTVTLNDDRRIEVEDWFDRVTGVSDEEQLGLLYGYDTTTGLAYAFFLEEIVT